jgi:hypothetical protein
MKFSKLKVIIPLILLVLSFRLIGYEKTIKSPKNSNESKVNINELLEYKDSKVGNNSAVGNIISNLPANIYSEGFELQTTSKPYEISINYEDFEETYIKFEDGSSVSTPFPDTIKKNAMIMLSLVENADIVNFNLNDGVMITYRRDELVDAHKEEYGVNLEKIIQNKSSLESFIKDDIN